MGKDFGTIRNGEEQNFSILLFSMEGNVLKVHRQFPSSNSRKLRESIALVLFGIKERVTGISFDTSAFQNEENERLEKALLYAFDPFSNNEVLRVITDQFGTSEFSSELLKSYYQAPVMCLLWIKESIDNWERHGGINGYFEFLERFMGEKITGDKMQYTCMCRKYK